ncbi:MAG: FkbM family methyltransferase [Vicinamibacteria bacterium]|nr:FkbM family methyltransferase [Vicinamibacteria bacterium]
MKKRAAVIALMIAFTASLVAVGYGAFKIGRAWERSLMLYYLGIGASSREPQRAKRDVVSLRKALIRYHSCCGQDQWIAEEVFPGVRDGFYVDVGAGDGVIQSNTKALDDMGWKGICVDPFPTNMASRTASVFKDVVYSEPGHKVTFRASGFMGGIESLFKSTKDWDAHRKAGSVELVTTTLDEILSRANAPKYIHYMNIDIEGAELEALRGLSLGNHKVGAFTIEHNWEEPKRGLIRRLLESQGYMRVFGLDRDDFFVGSELLGVPETHPHAE